MKIGIIGPSEEEVMPFVKKIENGMLYQHAMLNFYEGHFEHVPVVAVVSGVCKVNAAIAAQILIDKFDVTHVILTGVAGALDDQLEIGDIVIADEIAYHDVAKEILTEYHPWMKDIYFRTDKKMLNDAISILEGFELKNNYYVGRIITGEAFVTEKERDKLIKEFNPMCVDMESGSVAHVCFANAIPFIVIRSISDNANENGSETFESHVETVSLNSLLLVEELIKSYR